MDEALRGGLPDREYAKQLLKRIREQYRKGDSTYRDSDFQLRTLLKPFGLNEAQTNSVVSNTLGTSYNVDTLTTGREGGLLNTLGAYVPVAPVNYLSQVAKGVPEQFGNFGPQVEKSLASIGLSMTESDPDPAYMAQRQPELDRTSDSRLLQNTLSLLPGTPNNADAFRESARNIENYISTNFDTLKNKLQSFGGMVQSWAEENIPTFELPGYDPESAQLAQERQERRDNLADPQFRRQQLQQIFDRASKEIEANPLPFSQTVFERGAASLAGSMPFYMTMALTPFDPVKLPTILFSNAVAGRMVAGEAVGGIAQDDVWLEMSQNMTDAQKQEALSYINPIVNFEAYNTRTATELAAAGADALSMLPIGGLPTRLGLDLMGGGASELIDFDLAGRARRRGLRAYAQKMNLPIKDDPRLQLVNRGDYAKAYPAQAQEAFQTGIVMAGAASTPTTLVDSLFTNYRNRQAQDNQNPNQNPEQIQALTNTVLNKLKTLNKKDPEQVRSYLENPITEDVVRNIQAKSDAGQALSKDETEIAKRHNEIDTPILAAPESTPTDTATDALAEGVAREGEYYRRLQENAARPQEKIPDDSNSKILQSAGRQPSLPGLEEAPPTPQDPRFEPLTFTTDRARSKVEQQALQDREARMKQEQEQKTLSQFYEDISEDSLFSTFDQTEETDLGTVQTPRDEYESAVAYEDAIQRQARQLEDIRKLQQDTKTVQKAREAAEKRQEALIKADQRIAARDLAAEDKQRIQEKLAADKLANEQRLAEIADVQRGLDQRVKEAKATQVTAKEELRIQQQDALEGMNEGARLAQQRRLQEQANQQALIDQELRLLDQDVAQAATTQITGRQAERARQDELLSSMEEEVDTRIAEGALTPREATIAQEEQARAEEDRILQEIDRMEADEQSQAQAEEDLAVEQVADQENRKRFNRLLVDLSDMQTQRDTEQRVQAIFGDLETSERSTVAGGATINPNTPRGAQILKQRELEVLRDAMVAEFPGVSQVDVVETVEQAREMLPEGTTLADDTEGFAFRDAEGNPRIVLVGNNIENKQVIEGQTGNALENAVRDGVRIFFHESLGHDGLRQAFGDNEAALNDFTARLYEARKAEIDQWGRNRYSTSDWSKMNDYIKAEEWLVQNFTEEGIAPSGILDSIRVLFGSEFNDASIRKQMNAIQTALRKGRKPKFTLRTPQGARANVGEEIPVEEMEIEIPGQTTTESAEATSTGTPAELGPIPKIPGVVAPTKTMLENARTRFGSSIPNERYRRLLESQYEGILQQLYDMTAAGRTPTAADKKQARLLLAELNAIQELLGSAPTETVAQTEAAPEASPVQEPVPDPDLKVGDTIRFQGQDVVVEGFEDGQNDEVVPVVRDPETGDVRPVPRSMREDLESTSPDVQPEATPVVGQAESTVPKLVTSGSVENVNVGDTIVVDGEERTVTEIRNNQGMLFPVFEENGQPRAVIPSTAGLEQVSPAVRMSSGRRKKLISELPISGILSGTEDLGTQPGDFFRNLGLPVRTKKDGTVKPSVSDVGSSLEKRYRKITGNVPFEDTPEQRDIIAEALNAEIEYQLQQDNSGVGWYDATVTKALNRYAIMHPELADNADARTVFKAILAITSQGETVPKNGDYAHKLYSEYKKTGRIPTTFEGGKEGPIVLNNLQFLQKLIDKYGVKAANDLLLAKMPVREVNKLSAQFGKAGVGGERMDTELLGAAAFGPKIGIFFSNLSGQYDFPTIDLWFQRTMGRMQGQLFDFKPGTDEKYRKLLRDHWAKNPKNFTPSKTVKQIPEDDLSLNLWAKETLNEYAKPVPTGKFKPDGTPIKRSYPVEKKTLETNAAKNIIENLTKLKGAPTGADRILTRDVLQRIQDKRANNNQEILTVPDMQAVLWYLEKDLYTGQGAGNVTAEKADYADAAEQVIEAYGNKEQKRQLQRARISGNDPRGDSGASSQNTGTDPVSGRESGSVGRTAETGPVEQGLSQGPRRSDGRRWNARGKYQALEGTPIIKDPSGPIQGPIPELVDVAERYAAANGIEYKRQAEYVPVNQELATRIAQAYAEMEHKPNDPTVKAAYRDLIDQTRAQYEALVADGYEFTFFDGETDPYEGRPFRAMKDLRFNKRMAVYGTYDGYGTEGITRGDLEDNPMLEDTGLQWEDQNGEMRPVMANDLFRAVHDAFGHGLEGAGFRAQGEENAWQAHARLFTGPALGAITSETRGQNSWLNYGPYGETNRTASLEDTVFADQKTGLMPEWTWQEGKAPDMPEDTQEENVNDGANLTGTRFSSGRRRPLQNNPGGRAKKEFGALKALRKLDHFFDHKSNLPEREAYELLTQKARGEMTNYIEIGHELGDIFLKAKENEQAAIYNYLTERNANANLIPDRKVRGSNKTLRQAAVQAKQDIIGIGEDLVRLGMLDPDAYANRKGKYLPRVYLKYLFSEDHQKILSTGGSLKMSDLGYLKKRKDVDALVRNLVLGEIKSPGYLVSKTLMQSGQDIARMQFLKDLSGNQEWVLPESYINISYANEIESILQANPALRQQLLNEGLPPAARQTATRRVTPEYLAAEARRLREQVLPSKKEGSAQKELVRRMIEVLDQKVSQARTNQEYDPENYTQLPDTSRYGDLRGAIVRNEIYDDLVGSQELFTQSGMERGLNYLTSLMKWGLTAANPAVWANNLRSNTAMMHFAGLPFHRSFDYRFRALKQMLTNGSRYQAFKDQGLTLSTFAADELGRMETRLAQSLSPEDKKIIGQPLRYSLPVLTAERLGSLIYNAFGDFYQGMEVMDKLALGMYLEDHGPSLGAPFANNRKMTTEAAMREANKALFDYTDVPDWLRRSRRSLLGAPFLTWTYKAAPYLTKMAGDPKKLLRAATWYGGLYTLMAMREAELDDEEHDAYYNGLQDWLAKRQLFSIPLPQKDENGMVQTEDYTMFAPHAFLMNAAADILPGGRFSALDVAKDLGFASHPLLESTMELIFNKDSFTGQPIYRSTDTSTQMADKIREHYMDNLLPQFIAPNGWTTRMIELSSDNPNVFGPSSVLDRQGNPTRTLGQQAQRVVPFMPNVYPSDLRKGLKYGRQDILRSIQALAKEYSTNRRKYRGDREALAELKAEYDAERARLQGLLREFPTVGQLPRFEEYAE